MSLFDIHAHTGFNDPDGFRSRPSSCWRRSRRRRRAGRDADARARRLSARERPRHAEGAASDGRLAAFCRLDPKLDAVVEARRCIDAGARGIKLHPRAEGFELADPEVDGIFALAHERRLPLMIHAGRGIPTLARDAVELATRYPGARIMLAHAAICDLNWLWRVSRGTRTS